MESVGRLKGKSPKGVPFLTVSVSESQTADLAENQTASEAEKKSDTTLSLNIGWDVAKFKEALVRDGAYLLRANQGGWSPQEFWET